MTTKIFCDSGDLNGIKEAAKNLRVVGFTTNPTLLAKAGVTDYEGFAKEAITFLKANRPDTNLSLEVFATDKETIKAQALKISSWGEEADYKVYVKIPIVNPDGTDNYDLIGQLSPIININVTAVFTENQIYNAIHNLINGDKDHIISIFAGRIADVGHDPIAKFKFGASIFNKMWHFDGDIDFLWASTRQPSNYSDAVANDVDIITMTPDQISKVEGFYKKDLYQFSVETSAMFANDAVKSGFTINV